MRLTRQLVLRLTMALAVGLAHAAPSAEDLDRRMSEAIGLNDAGKFGEAVARFEGLLADYPQHPRVLYEAAFSSSNAGKWKEAIDYAERCLKTKGPYAAQCLVLIGSAYDSLGDSAKAEKAFRRGIKDSPDNGLLRFNLGVNLVQQNKPEKAIEELLASVVINPGHASSWRALGSVYRGLGLRASAFLAYSRFLTLEPDTDRTRTIAPRLWALLFEGVTIVPNADGTTDTNIAIILPDVKSAEDREMQVMIMSIVAATRNLDKEKDMSDAQWFAEAFDKVLAIQGELHASGKKNESPWTATAGYFGDARKAGHLEAMAYDTRRTIGDAETLTWISAHVDAVERYRDWSKTWKPARQ